jgi:hypothetical protein
LDFFFYNPECLSQFMHTTTNFQIHWTPYKPNKQVRYCEDNRHPHKDSNLKCRDRKYPAKTAMPITWMHKLDLFLWPEVASYFWLRQCKGKQLKQYIYIIKLCSWWVDKGI